MFKNNISRRGSAAFIALIIILFTIRNYERFIAASGLTGGGICVHRIYRYISYIPIHTDT